MFILLISGCMHNSLLLRQLNYLTVNFGVWKVANRSSLSRSTLGHCVYGNLNCIHTCTNKEVLGGKRDWEKIMILHWLPQKRLFPMIASFPLTRRLGFFHVLFKLCTQLLIFIMIHHNCFCLFSDRLTLANDSTLEFPSNLDDLRRLSQKLHRLHQQQPGFVLLLFSSAYLYKQTFAIPGSVFLVNIFFKQCFDFDWSVSLIRFFPTEFAGRLFVWTLLGSGTLLCVDHRRCVLLFPFVTSVW